MKKQNTHCVPFCAPYEWETMESMDLPETMELIEMLLNQIN
jgi:hypothetical protein